MAAGRLLSDAIPVFFCTGMALAVRICAPAHYLGLGDQRLRLGYRFGAGGPAGAAIRLRRLARLVGCASRRAGVVGRILNPEFGRHPRRLLKSGYGQAKKTAHSHCRR